jgi:hypothetical protein
MGMGMGQPVVGSRSINRRGLQREVRSQPIEQGRARKRHEHGYGHGPTIARGPGPSAGEAQQGK